VTDQERLDDAREQYHLLVTGQQAKVYVDQNGERVEYTTANRSALLAYIQRLEQAVAGSNRPSGPMRVLF